MRSTARSFRLANLATLIAIATLATSFAAAAPARAAGLAARTFLASFGNDANSCTSPQDPCRSFSAALNKTETGGQISILDGGPYGGPGINKSITVDGESAGGAVVRMALSIFGDARVVVLRGLVLNGADFSSDIVRFAGSGTLQVENCVIDGTGTERGGTNGIVIEADGDSRVVIADTVIRNVVENDAHGLRVLALSPGSGSLRLALDRVRLVGNTNGMAFVVQRGEGVVATIRDSLIALNELHGAQVTSSAPTVDVMIERTTFADNGLVGLAAGGSRATVRLRTVTVTHNDVGISGAILSYGDNVIDANGIDGAPAQVGTLQ